ncbi:hypothetical protein BGX26_001865 [Mortierella sp. AD094]|nr:hypothetical protein BGX26_001865 [Mortierella sp. AD094]
MRASIDLTSARGVKISVWSIDIQRLDFLLDLKKTTVCFNTRGETEVMSRSGGLGAQIAMSDAVVLANYINILTSVGPEDVEKALMAYKTEQYPFGKIAVKNEYSCI